MDTNGRRFFEHYTSAADGGEMKVVRTYCCPCCGLPTLSERAGYEICEICSWEDDGSNGYGPNACSLDEAREHFRQYLTSYSPTHEISPKFQRDGLRFVHQLELSPANLEAKRRKIAALERYMAEQDLDRRGEWWRAAHGELT
jgi:hypothetical protein